MKPEEFETFWHGLKTWLSTRQSIRNWTVFHKTTGENFEAEYGKSDYILAYPQPPAKTQRTPKADFKIVFENWEEYTSGKVRRSEFVHGPIAFSRFTKIYNQHCPSIQNPRTREARIMLMCINAEQFVQ